MAEIKAVNWPQTAALVTALLGGSAIIQAGHPGLRAIPPAGWAGVLLVAGPLLVVLIARWLRPELRWLRALGSVEIALGAIGGLIVVAIPAAIWPQGEPSPGWLQRLGLGDLFTSLPYAAMLGLLLLNLASVCGLRCRRCQRGDLPLLGVHLGLLLALAAAAAGSGSFLRGRLILQEGAPANDLVIDPLDRPLARLPQGLILDDFRMREAAPRLVLSQGGALEVSRASIDDGDRLLLAGLQIEILERLPQVAIIEGTPQPFAQPGARPAVFVRLGAAGEILGEGWLHAPSRFGEALFLSLDNGRSLLLEEPRPSYFASDLRLPGEATPILLEVNRPLKLGAWWCYQSGYDDRAGPASTISVLDCVYDPSYPWVRLGLIVFLCGILGDLLQRRLPGRNARLQLGPQARPEPPPIASDQP